MKQICFSRAIIIFYIALLFLCLPFSYGQDIDAADTTPATENAVKSVEPLQIKLSVNEIRLDVVVLDKKTGNPITDLTADDFEVFQDDRRQTILSSVYIDSQPDVAMQPSVAQKDGAVLPPLPTTALKKEDVRRTILFVVDDYSMDFGNGYYTKRVLHDFVEKQMLIGDLVAIMRTNYGNSALNMFHSDKREVLARINAMPATMAQRFDHTETDRQRDRVTAESYDNFLRRAHENQIATISYSLRAMKEMPGRKVLIMVTPLTVHTDIRMFSSYYESYIKLADEALRAGVVINLLDIDGLRNLNSMRADAAISMGQASIFERGVGIYGGAARTQEVIISMLQQTQFEPIRVPNPMPERTGGIIIEDSNFFLKDGIGKEVENLMRGYYLISYEPPPNTFEKRGRKDAFRRLKVRVNRKDAVVHTRTGFFGTLESELTAKKHHPLIEAIISPFQSTDLNVDIAAGFVKDAKAGYVVRSWIHLDPGDVKIVETEDGGARIDLEMLCVTSDVNGDIKDSKSAEFTLNVKPENKAENLAWIRRHGIRFSLLLPVKKPGTYYVQVSIQDAQSGKIGSAYQFLEIPDLGKKNAGMSNIFIITSADDLDWLRSDITKQIGGGVFLPVLQGDIRSPALRTYMPGDSFQAMATLYNVDAKAIARSEIDIQSVLYKDRAEFLRGNPVSIAPDEVQSAGNSIPILRRFTVGPEMPPGDYILQFLAINKKNSNNTEVIASQTLSFTVAEK